jgi:uncharacterized protein (TIGR02284 family)
MRTGELGREDMQTKVHNEVVAAALAGLMQTNRDSETGYWTAAESVNDPALHTLFHRYAQRRARYAAELERELRGYGGEASTGASFSGRVRRSWLHLKAALTGDNVGAVLAECDRAEQAALEDYEAALHEDLPEHLKEMIRQQHDDLQESRQHLRALKETGQRHCKLEGAPGR